MRIRGRIFLWPATTATTRAADGECTPPGLVRLGCRPTGSARFVWVPVLGELSKEAPGAGASATFDIHKERVFSSLATTTTMPPPPSNHRKQPSQPTLGVVPPDIRRPERSQQRQQQQQQLRQQRQQLHPPVVFFQDTNAPRLSAAVCPLLTQYPSPKICYMLIPSPPSA